MIVGRRELVAVLPTLSTDAAFCATTPPQIKATRTTDAKGVNLDNVLANFGALAFNIIPNVTGSKTTRAVASQSAMPLTSTALPTNSLTRRGVTPDASMVEHAVSSTERATSAPAIKETRLLAVPPGLHPTRVNPRNSAGPRTGSKCSKRVRPMAKAVRGMIMNWQSTPAGTDVGLSTKTSVKSFFSKVIPVPSMTVASMTDIRLPPLTHVSAAGARRPTIADRRTKNGNPDVRSDRMESTLLLLLVDAGVSTSPSVLCSLLSLEAEAEDACSMPMPILLLAQVLAPALRHERACCQDDNLFATKLLPAAGYDGPTCKQRLGNDIKGFDRDNAEGKEYAAAAAPLEVGAVAVKADTTLLLPLHDAKGAAKQTKPVSADTGDLRMCFIVMAHLSPG
mmetsp:Transcript_14188/g.30793  ORF Transcript_14188/g.30793 Transcript_14188/m.30793 type:complete len:395 (+) Transcript_14188:375-1559(+)